MQTRLWLVLAESACCGSVESGGWFYVGVFGRNLTSRREDVFTFNLIFKIF
jgi:hypothetical protein